jgi:hypothetical protein
VIKGSNSNEKRNSLTSHAQLAKILLILSKNGFFEAKNSNFVHTKTTKEADFLEMVFCFV